MPANKLYRRSVRGTVPYDDDLVPSDLDEIFAYSMVPFLRWDTVVFCKWLYESLHLFMSAPLSPLLKPEEELLYRKDTVNNLLMPEEQVIRDGYDPLGFAISIGNIAMVQHVYMPFKYLENIEDWYRDRILVMAQKSGNIEMLKIINEALFSKKP